MPSSPAKRINPTLLLEDDDGSPLFSLASPFSPTADWATRGSVGSPRPVAGLDVTDNLPFPGGLNSSTLSQAQLAASGRAVNINLPSSDVYQLNTNPFHDTFFPVDRHQPARPGRISLSTDVSELVVGDANHPDTPSSPPCMPANSSRQGNTYHVWQTQKSDSFNVSFLNLCINDVVIFHWFDYSHHIYETDSTYDHAISGEHRSPLKSPESEDSLELEAVHTRRRMTYEHCFPNCGAFFFVCSRDKRHMRLHVQVKREPTHRRSCGLFIFISVVLLVIVIVVVVFPLAYSLQKKDLFLSRDDAMSDAAYDSFKELQSLFTLTLLPWVATGFLVILMVVLINVGMCIHSTVSRRSQGPHSQGVPRGLAQLAHIGAVVCCSMTIGLFFLSYGLELVVTDGLCYFTEQLSSSVSATVREYAVSTTQANRLVAESFVFPAVKFPEKEINATTERINTVLEVTQKVTLSTADVAQGILRLLPILLFLTLQLGLFAMSVTIGALITNFRRPLWFVVWLLALSVGVYAFSCGFVGFISRLLQVVNNSAGLFKDDPGSLAVKWNIDPSSLFVSVCTADWEAEYLSKYVTAIMNDIYAGLNSTAQESFLLLFDIAPLTTESLANYTNHVHANLDQMMSIMANGGKEIDAVFQTNTGEFLLVLFDFIDALDQVANCQVLRNVVASAIPILQERVVNYNAALTVTLSILFGVSVVTVIISSLSTYAREHPRRHWYETLTGRWFRLRYSYKVQKELQRRGSTVVVEKQPMLSSMQLPTGTPFMVRLRTIRLVCAASGALMFFNSVLLVLFKDIAQSVVKAPLVSALAYLGCVPLILLLVSAVVRQTWLRRSLDVCALGIVVTVLIGSITQMAQGYHNFSRYIHSPRIIGDLPDHEGTILTAGLQLEIAVYATVIMLNCIILGTSLVLLLFNERHLMASLQPHPYVGCLSPLGRLACLRCLFVDHLTVKRIFVGFFTLMLVTFLACLTVANNYSFSVMPKMRRAHEIGSRDI